MKPIIRVLDWIYPADCNGAAIEVADPVPSFVDDLRLTDKVLQCTAMLLRSDADCLPCDFSSSAIAAAVRDCLPAFSAASDDALSAAFWAAVQSVYGPGWIDFLQVEVRC